MLVSIFCEQNKINFVPACSIRLSSSFSLASRSCRSPSRSSLFTLAALQHKTSSTPLHPQMHIMSKHQHVHRYPYICMTPTTTFQQDSYNMHTIIYVYHLTLPATITLRSDKCAHTPNLFWGKTINTILLVKIIN